MTPKLVIAGIEVPNARSRRWNVTEPSAAEAEAFATGYRGEILEIGEEADAVTLRWLRIWYWRGRAVREHHEAARARIERVITERGRKEAERMAALAAGARAYRQGFSVLASPYHKGPDRRPDLHRFWREGWRTERERALEERLAPRLPAAVSGGGAG